VATAALPSGTVTFLFTDIEGSTRLALELGKRWADVLAEHQRTLREIFTRHGGVEVDTQGDAFFVAFGRASDAVAAARDVRAALNTGPVRVRIGLHTGEATLRDKSYVGVEVHRGARIAAAGHGGQVLVSHTTRDLVGSSFELLDLGLHRLKDLSEPQRLYQFGTDEFPPLKTLAQTNLPVPPTPFLGRERELDDVVRLLRSSRLLTLTGPGGSGKTRLAAHAAAEAADEFPAGVWWIALAALHDPALVPEAISETLGAKIDLARHIGDQEVLLVLDNFEHVVASAPELAALLERCSGLRLLVTSREPLRLAAEQEYAVPPLVPDEAVQFFCARARASQPAFEDGQAVAEICRRLDNLPLALELAATRVKVLSADQILARLARALPLLTGGPRDAPERQRTLEAAIAWSYEMLSEDEQLRLADLAVFAGGWTLEAAEAICGADLDTVGSLVDKSLVRQSGERFSMLATIREFALERLRERGALTEVGRRHAEYFLAAAELNYGEFLENLTPDQLGWFEREHDNLRAALDRLHEPDTEPELEIRLAIACAKFLLHRGLFAEARQRLEEALARADDAPALLRARLLWIVGEVALVQGDALRGKDLATQSVRVLDELQATSFDVVIAHNALATCEQRLGNTARAAEIFEQAERLARAGPNDLTLAIVLSNVANLALDRRDFGGARAPLEESAAITDRLGQRPHFANALVDLGFVALAEGDVDQSATHFHDSLSICRAERVTHTLVWVLEGLAAVAAERAEPVLAAKLLAVTGTMRTTLGFGEGHYTLGDEFRARTLERARTALGDAAFDDAFAEGEALSADDAAAAAAQIM
jgi:predicted ATPase/class 3 adenylate cyclase